MEILDFVLLAGWDEWPLSIYVTLHAFVVVFHQVQVFALAGLCNSISIFSVSVPIQARRKQRKSVQMGK